VEPKIAGIFMKDLILYGGLGICLCIVLGRRLFKTLYSKSTPSPLYNFDAIPESDRVYYEIISDMITQMHDTIGDKAYQMANAITGLSVDVQTGKILRTTKDPSEIVSVLYIRYQNVFKRKLNISARSESKKIDNNAKDVEKNLDEFEKYFHKK
jgi:hypothetical protein